jgi:hypothetical protein
VAEASKKVVTLVGVAAGLATVIGTLIAALTYIDSHRPTSPDGPVSLSDCLVGTWVETSVVADAMFDGEQVKMTGVGAKHIFTKAGKMTDYFGNGVTRSGTRNGHKYERTYTGAIIWDFTVKDDQVVTTNPVANGTRTDKIDGKVVDTSPIAVSGGNADHYTCSGDRVTTESDGFVATFTRE